MTSTNESSTTNNFSNVDNSIMDVLLNVSQAYLPSDVSETLTFGWGYEPDQIEEKLEEHITNGFIKKDTYYSINPSYIAKAKVTTANFLADKGITIDTFNSFVEEQVANQAKLGLYVSLLGHIQTWEQRK